MKLLNEIIDLLSNEGGSIHEALLKTKVLLHKIGQQQLVGWVNDELNGYGDGKPIPDYRKVFAHVCGQIANPRVVYASQPLPTAQLPDHIRRSFEETKMNQAIGVLEKLAEGAGTLQRPVPVELNHLFNEALGGASQSIELGPKSTCRKFARSWWKFGRVFSTSHLTFRLRLEPTCLMRM